MISTNFFPNDPVPPVTRIDCSDQFIPIAFMRIQEIRRALLLGASAWFRTPCPSDCWKPDEDCYRGDSRVG
jgi:hypothetical protein